MAMEVDIPVSSFAMNQDNGPILWHMFEPMGQRLVLLVPLGKLLTRHVSQGDMPAALLARALPTRVAEAAYHRIQGVRLDSQSPVPIAVRLDREGLRTPA